MLVIFPYYQLSIGYSLFKWFRRCYSKCTQIISEATFLEKYFSFVWRLKLQVVWIFQANFDLSNILQLFMSKEEFLSHRNSHCSRRISCQTCAANFPRVQTLISHLVRDNSCVTFHLTLVFLSACNAWLKTKISIASSATMFTEICYVLEYEFIPSTSWFSFAKAHSCYLYARSLGA